PVLHNSKQHIAGSFSLDGQTGAVAAAKLKFWTEQKREDLAFDVRNHRRSDCRKCWNWQSAVDSRPESRRSQVCASRRCVAAWTACSRGIAERRFQRQRLREADAELRNLNALYIVDAVVVDAESDSDDGFAAAK